MKNHLIIEGKKYIKSREAAELTGYSLDYVGQLSRSGKIDSKLIGRTWFVSEDSIVKYKNLGLEEASKFRTSVSRDPDNSTDFGKPMFFEIFSKFVFVTILVLAIISSGTYSLSYRYPVVGKMASDFLGKFDNEIYTPALSYLGAAEEGATQVGSAVGTVASDQTASVLSSIGNGLLGASNGVKSAIRNWLGLGGTYVQIPVTPAVSVSQTASTSVATNSQTGGVSKPGVGGNIVTRIVEQPVYVSNVNADVDLKYVDEGFVKLRNQIVALGERMRSQTDQVYNSISQSSSGNSGAGAVAGISDLNSFTTGDLAEGSNLYFTDSRVAAALGSATSTTFGGTVTATTYYGDGSNLSGLLSFSTSTTRGAFSATSSLTYDSVNGVFGISTSTLGLTTSNVSEGSRLYYTDARVDARISATTSLPNISTLAGLTSAPSLASIGTITSGVWNGTAIGSAYLGSARTLFSTSATGLTYTSGTGDFSLTSGYTIPLTASTTEWANKVTSQWTTSGSNIYFATGNVGIGSTTPSAKLTVNGNSYLGGNVTATGTISLGTSSPATLAADGNGALTIAASGTNQGITLSPTGSGKVNVIGGIVNTQSSQLAFHQNNAEVIDFASGGSGYVYAQYKVQAPLFEVGNAGQFGFSATAGQNGTIDTALYRNAAGALEINNGTAGTWRDLIVRNLSVGTTSTSSAITLADSTSATGGIQFGSDISLYRYGVHQLAINDPVSSNPVFAFKEAGATKARLQTTGGLFIISNDGASDLRLQTNNSAANLVFQSGAASTAMTILGSNQNVGIGTTTPSSKLTVAGTTTISGGPIIAEAANGAGTAGALQINNTGATKGYTLGNGTWFTAAIPYLRPVDTDTTLSFDIMPNGNGGSSLIHVCGNDVVANNASTYECLKLGMTFGTYASLTTSAGGSGSYRPLILQENGANVGIGTTTPTYKLDVLETANSGAGIRVVNTNTSTGAAATVRLENNAGSFGSLFKFGSGYSTYKTLAANNLGLYNNTSGNISILNDYASGKITLAAGGSATTALAIDSNNYVAIGTSTAAYPLDIAGATGRGIHISSAGADDGIYLGAASATNGSFSQGSVFNGTNWIAKGTTAGIFNSNAGALRFYSDSGLTAGNSYTPTERMTLTTAGNLGIGTTTPAAKLAITGVSGATTDLFSVASSTNTPVFTVASNGNVGIGSSSPSVPLSFSDAVGDKISLGKPGSNPFLIRLANSTDLELTANGSLYFSSGAVGSQTFKFANNGAQTNAGTSAQLTLYASSDNTGLDLALRKTALPASSYVYTAQGGGVFPATNWGDLLLGPGNQGGGQVFIGRNAQFVVGTNNTAVGTTTASAKFSIQQAFGGTGALFDVASTTSATFATSSMFRVNANGNVGIASSTPGYVLSVAGKVGFSGLTNNPTANYVCITASNEVVYSTTACAGVSSQVYKHDINSIPTGGLTQVMNLRPVSFIYNSDISPNDQSKHLGFIAEEVNIINKDLVAFDKDGTIRSVKYDEFIPVLTKAIQELNLKVDALGTAGIASGTASSSPAFIASVASSVKDLISSAGEWVLTKITATLAVFNRVETQTASISQGLEMKDQTTGAIYCVMINNGDWDKRVGTCAGTPVPNNAAGGGTTTPATGTSTIEVATTTIPTVPDTATTTPDIATTTPTVPEIVASSTTEVTPPPAPVIPAETVPVPVDSAVEQAVEPSI